MKNDKKSVERTTVARNFIKSYGRKRFEWFLSAIKQGTSGQIIAEEFNVSRERVRQWKNTFGVVITTYRIYDDISEILRKIEKDTSRR